MAETDPKKIIIQKDVPSGKTLSPDPQRIPLEMPPPPKPDTISQLIQKNVSKNKQEIGLPPLPDNLKPEPIQASPNNAPPIPYQAFSPPPVAHPPIPPQSISSPSAIPEMAPPAEQFHAQSIPSQPETETMEVPTEPVHDPLQKELKQRISHINGPVFISLERYREVKDILYSLKANSHDLRSIMDEFKGNKKEGAELLTQSVDRLEHIEEDIENINATLRV